MDEPRRKGERGLGGAGPLRLARRGVVEGAQLNYTARGTTAHGTSTYGATTYGGTTYGAARGLPCVTTAHGTARGLHPYIWWAHGRAYGRRGRAAESAVWPADCAPSVSASGPRT